ncbi:MAG: hypothetical protein HUK25_05695 [Treponema sp.]|nr:hypothetical protein [Treponema sp.]
MSYTQNFRTSVTVTGSKSVSYPASEHGGSTTVYFEKTEPVNISIYVDTEAFDSRIYEAESNIDNLTGSVVAMNSAQCASIIRSGEEISNTITKGFYKLIGSEVTTQISENKSQLQSKFALVMELAKDINNKHSRMEIDINRLKRHYGEIFKGLDEDCRKRVLSLDKPSFILSNCRTKLIKNPYLKEGAFSLHEISDTTNSNNLSTIARLRSQVSNVINVITNSELKTRDYLRNVQTFSENIPVSEKQVSMIPVIFYEEQDICEKNRTNLNSVCNSFIPSSNEIQNQVCSFVSGTNADNWISNSEYEEKMIDQNFIALAESDFANNSSDEKQRIHDTVMKLWKSNSIKTLKGV